MLMMPDKKKMATMIVAKLKGGPEMKGPSEKLEAEYVSNEEPEEDSDIGLEACMDSLLSAIEAKDSKGMMVALRDFIEMAMDSKMESSEG